MEEDLSGGGSLVKVFISHHITHSIANIIALVFFLLCFLGVVRVFVLCGIFNFPSHQPVLVLA